MADFRLYGGEAPRTQRAVKASATVIEAGDLVGIDTGLIIKATAASTKLAWCPEGGANGETVVEITEGNDFTLKGTGDAVFAVAQKGTTVDLVVNANAQQVDVGTSSTNVLDIDCSENAGTVGSASNIVVRIAKPIF